MTSRNSLCDTKKTWRSKVQKYPQHTWPVNLRINYSLNTVSVKGVSRLVRLTAFCPRSSDSCSSLVTASCIEKGSRLLNWPLYCHDSPGLSDDLDCCCSDIIIHSRYQLFNPCNSPLTTKWVLFEQGANVSKWERNTAFWSATLTMPGSATL